MPYINDPATGQRILCLGTEEEAQALQQTLDKRKEIVAKWCAEHDIKSIDDLSIDEVLEIRQLPEWKNAGVAKLTLSTGQNK